MLSRKRRTKSPPSWEPLVTRSRGGRPPKNDSIVWISQLLPRVVALERRLEAISYRRLRVLRYPVANPL